MKEKTIYYKEAEGKKFYYITVGSKEYLRPVYRVWVSPKFFDLQNGYVNLPIQNVDIKEGKKSGNLILTEGDKTLYMVEIESGYRGHGYITEISTYGYDHKIWKFPLYKSERGSTGIGEGALVLTSSPKVKVKWEKDGKLYGKPSSGITLLYADGREEELDIDDEDLELLKELEGGE
jgi:hypothetical protein